MSSRVSVKERVSSRVNGAMPNSPRYKVAPATARLLGTDGKQNLGTVSFCSGEILLTLQRHSSHSRQHRR
jgi:hypothetical protein